ncbi:uncharacterized protein LOC130949491 [Arachis stenosperma]|uniref:uncharacterized protein LOC130949491 n=1 Tax=Arachis stenosperma TaxID=217475 RepID=UPI0025AC18C5|nr:uncharacterized protein LOC130949491 [Arachis stenosperma]
MLGPSLSPYLRLQKEICYWPMKQKISLQVKNTKETASELQCSKNMKAGTSEEANIIYEEEYVLNSRGMKLFASRWLPVNGNPKAIIFMCHGYAMECSITMNRNGKSDGRQGLVLDFNSLINDWSHYFTTISEKKENKKKMQEVTGLYLVLLVLCCTIIQAFSQTPVASPKPAQKAATSPPKATTKKAPSPKPLVPTLPQSPDSSDAAPDDIKKIRKKVKIFNVLIRLMKTTEIMNNINSQLITAKTGGIMILAPDDDAFTDHWYTKS